MCIAIAALALGAAPVFAQSSTTTGGTSSTTAGAATTTAKKSGTATTATSAKKMSDEAFVTEALKGGMAEVELGRLAAEKATDNDVKKFGQQMADDHAKAGEELKTLASNKHFTVAADMDPKDKALHDRLAKLSGAAFDRAYMQAMVTDHQKDVTAFKREADAGKDADIKAFAAKTLPTLEEHLKMARQADRKVVGTSGAKDKQSHELDKENSGAGRNGTDKEHTPTGDRPRTNF